MIRQPLGVLFELEIPEQLRATFKELRKRQTFKRSIRIAHDLNARYARQFGLDPAQSGRQEALLMDARAMAEAHLTEAATPQGRKKLADRVWRDCVERHPYYACGAFTILYAEFEQALLHKGHPSPGDLSLAQRAQQANGNELAGTRKLQS